MKNFVGIGGGEIPGWSFKTKSSTQTLYQTKKIDEFIVNLSQKKKPNLLFIGTASKENEVYFNAIKDIYEKLGCQVSSLDVLSPLIDMRIDDIRQKLFSSDIIYIGGGNTKFMLNKWCELGIDKLLIELYNKGVIISGFSAGCYSFFKYNYELIEGFNIINAIVCVHYDEKSADKKEQFYESIKEKQLPGIALDNGVAIHYFENNFEIIKAVKNAKAYRIDYKNSEFLKQELDENIVYEI